MNRRLHRFFRIEVLCSTMILLAALNPSFAQDAYDSYEYGQPAAPAKVSRNAAGEIVLEVGVFVKHLNQPTVFAAESGRLIKSPEPGAKVAEGDVIAKTDDTQALLQQRVTYMGYMAERTKLESDVELRYSKKSAEVRKEAYLDAKNANEAVAKAVSPNLVRQKKFEWESAELSVEKTVFDEEVIRSQARVKAAEYDLAKHMVNMHEIQSPINGRVKERFKEVGEWVRPGDPIALLVRTDRVKIVGNVPAASGENQTTLQGRTVVIEVPVKGTSDVRKFESQISYVALEFDGNEDLEIWAELESTDEFPVTAGMRGIKITLKR